MAYYYTVFPVHYSSSTDNVMLGKQKGPFLTQGMFFKDNVSHDKTPKVFFNDDFGK